MAAQEFLIALIGYEWPILSPVEPLSPFPPIVALLVATGTAFFLGNRFPPAPSVSRYASIDGLRGYLAVFVFLHHSCVWYFYLRTGRWEAPPSNLYVHFGQSSVALFFMITAFLFVSKLIDARNQGLDWTRLFISRALRLVPLYLFTMSLLMAIVAWLSKGKLNEPLSALLRNSFKWIGFTVLGDPDLNRVNHTSNIVAGVTWSLPYEWFFYFSLPLFSLLIGVRTPIAYLALGLANVAALIAWEPNGYDLASFLGGIFAAVLVRYEAFRSFSRSTSASALLIGSVAVAVTFFSSSQELVPLLLLSGAFAIVAGGNSLFGILTAVTSRALGETAYSIYLLHGMLLFFVFRVLVGTTTSSAWSPFFHWLVVVAVTPLLIALCFLTFRFVEHPAMRKTEWATHTLQCVLTRLRSSCISEQKRDPESIS